MLIYTNGEKYDAHCNKEERKAIIMISCDRNVKVVNEMCKASSRADLSLRKKTETKSSQLQPWRHVTSGL